MSYEHYPKSRNLSQQRESHGHCHNQTPLLPLRQLMVGQLEFVKVEACEKRQGGDRHKGVEEYGLGGRWMFKYHT